MPQAARLGDLVTHNQMVAGLLAGAAIGGAIAGGIIFTVGTAGIGPLLLGATLGAAATFGGEQAGMALGAMIPKGAGLPITSGSINVRINSLQAARVLDTTACHDNAPLLQGSSTVLINGRPAVRLGDKVACAASVATASPTVVIGGGQATAGAIAGIPGWARLATFAIEMVTGAGAAAALERALAGGAMEAGAALGARALEAAPARMSLADAVGEKQAQAWTAAGKANLARNGKAVGTLTDDEIGAIHGYTTNKGYKMLNPALRRAAPASDEMTAFASHVSSGMDKLPPVKTTSFRGEDMPGSLLDQHQIGESVADPGFKSSAADPSLAFPGRIQSTIEGVSGRDVSSFSNYDEQEILFKPNTRFDVVNRVENPDGTTQLHLKETGP